MGTTAEVVSVGTTTIDEETLSGSRGPCLAVLAKGRQRFELTRAFNDAKGLLWGEVLVLPELPPLEAPRGIHPLIVRKGGGGISGVAGTNVLTPATNSSRAPAGGGAGAATVVVAVPLAPPGWLLLRSHASSAASSLLSSSRSSPFHPTS